MIEDPTLWCEFCCKPTPHEICEERCIEPGCYEQRFECQRCYTRRRFGLTGEPMHKYGPILKPVTKGPPPLIQSPAFFKKLNCASRCGISSHRFEEERPAGKVAWEQIYSCVACGTSRRYGFTREKLTPYAGRMAA